MKLRYVLGALPLTAAMVGPGCGGKVRFEEPAGGSGGATPVNQSSVASSSTGGQGGDGGLGGAGGTPLPPPIPALVELEPQLLGQGEAAIADVPDSAVGVTSYSISSELFSTVGYESVIGPSGSNLVSGFGIPNTGAFFEGFGISTILVPQTSVPDAMPFAAGPFTFVTGAIDPPIATSAEVSTWYRQTVDGGFHGGVIDINVFAVSAVNDPGYMTSVITSAFDGYAGLSLGELNFFALSDAFTIIDDFNFYEGLLQTAGAPGRPALNILAIADFTGSLDDAAGVSPGAPANQLVHGTTQSGIYWQVLFDPFVDKLILQHESGHASGLMHTSEFIPGLGDALNDTAFCPNVQAQLFDCPDIDNVMFPTGGDGQLNLTAQQQTVLRASTLYRGIVEPGGAPAGPLPAPADFSIRPAPLPAGPTSDWGARARVDAGASRDAWKAFLPSEASQYVGGLWCANGTAAPDFAKRLLALSRQNVGALLRVAQDPYAPSFVRGRAWSALGQSAPSPTLAAPMARAASDAQLSPSIRFQALQALAHHDRQTAVTMTEAMMAGSDAALAAVARAYRPRMP